MVKFGRRGKHMVVTIFLFLPNFSTCMPSVNFDSYCQYH